MKRNGQVAIYLLLVIVAVLMLALLNVDVFLAVRAKNNVENGGDAAAIAASRAQGDLINEIGRLNIEHMQAAGRGDWKACIRIEAEQRRLALTGPVYALRNASDAAKKNNLEERDDFAEILKRHVSDIRLKYAGGDGEHDPYPESYPGAWTEYASAINTICEEGLAAGPDNVEFYDADGKHLLYNRNFYNAIAGEDWCWFLFHCEGALNNYVSFTDWGPLPGAKDVVSTENSEIFSLHLKAKRGALADIFTDEELVELAKRFAVEIDPEAIAVTNLFTDPEQTWFFFDESAWGRWFDGRRLLDDEDGNDFPLVGEVKEEYNVRGCAAICRTVKSAENFTAGSRHDISWCAAAKPFGTVKDAKGREDVVTTLKYFVTPCMTDTRLVPVDAVGGENLATADYSWITHIREHLPGYVFTGPRTNGGCWYCMQLITWEQQSFHTRGMTWLKYHSGECVRPVGGTRMSGGSSHGH